MKKSVLFFAVLAVAVGVRAQLVEHYDNPRRYQFTPFSNHDSIEVYGISPQLIGDSIINKIYFSREYTRRERQNYVYGIAIPIYTDVPYKLATSYNCFRNTLNYLDTSQCSVIIGNTSQSETYEYELVSKVRTGIGRYSLIGNYFKMPDSDSSRLYRLTFPVLEVYFPHPVPVSEHFIVGVNLMPMRIISDSIYHLGASPMFISHTGDISENSLFTTIIDSCYINKYESPDWYTIDTNLWGAPFPILTPAPCMAPIWMNVAEQHRDGTIIGATIEWRGQYGSTSFEVEYGPQGFAEGTGTTVGPIAPDASRRGSVTINGLQMNADYTVRVRAQCNNDEAAGYTDWAEMDFHTDSRFIITVSANDESLGFTTGGGEYAAGTTAQLFAFPRSNCPFRNWNDGNNQNPRTITVTRDTAFVAFFGCDSTTSIATADGYTASTYASPNPTHGKITVTAGSTITSLTLFDIQGRTVMEAAPMTESATLDLGTLRPAVYILKLTTAEGPQTLKIVKQ